MPLLTEKDKGSIANNVRELIIGSGQTGTRYTLDSYLAYAARAFFDNGGQVLYVNRISIDPLHDLSRNQIVKLQVYAKDDENNPMDTFLAWFKTIEFYPGYRIFIDPSIDFEEMQTVNLEISAINLDLLSMLGAFWFQTEHFDVLVNILPGYPNVSLISKVVNFDTAIIKWETNKKVGAYQVEVAAGTGWSPV